MKSYVLSLALCMPFVLTGCNSDGSNGNESNAGTENSGNDNNGTPSETTSFVQQAYLKAINAGESDGFGYSVALDGDTLVVGTPNEEGDASSTTANPNDNAILAGAVYVFSRSGGVWSQQAYLKANNAESYDRFGTSIAYEDDTLVVGAPGEDGDVGSEATNPNDNAQDAGAVYVFTRANGAWSQQAYLKASNAWKWAGFGVSVSLDGDTLVAGAPGDDIDHFDTDSAAGAAYVFTRSGSAWSEQAYLKASNKGEDDAFGNSVVLDGDTMVVGAPGEDGDANSTAASPNDNASYAGAVYVFTRSSGTWSQQAYLKAGNAGTDDRFSNNILALDGDTLAVGAQRESGDPSSTVENPNDNAQNAGAVYVFTRIGEVWSQQAYLKASTWTPDQYGHQFGASVALDDDTLAVGAIYENGDANSTVASPNNYETNSGAAYLFIRESGVWKQQAFLKASNVEQIDNFGFGIALDKNTLAVGAIGEDGDSSSTVGNPNNNLSSAGAVYVFRD